MSRLARLQYNDLAPDLEILTAAGAPVRLSALWAQKPLVLAFTRHFGCLQCKEMLAELAQAQPELERVGLHVAAVTQGTPAEMREFCARYASGIFCLADPERRAYHAYGLERGNLWQLLLSPQVWRGTARAKRRGLAAGLAPQGQDVQQMSGTFIIGTDGRIRLPYYYDTIADHPPVELLLQGVLATGWEKPFSAPLASLRQK